MARRSCRRATTRLCECGAWRRSRGRRERDPGKVQQGRNQEAAQEYGHDRHKLTPPWRWNNSITTQGDGRGGRRAHRHRRRPSTGHPHRLRAQKAAAEYKKESLEFVRSPTKILRALSSCCDSASSSTSELSLPPSSSAGSYAVVALAAMTADTRPVPGLGAQATRGPANRRGTAISWP